MSQCKLSAEEFIQNAFCPQVAVLCSQDAEQLCRKNNLSFVQLIKPFCRLTNEAHIKDPNNVSHSIHNMKIGVQDMNFQAPPQTMVRKLLNDSVANVQPQLMEGNRGTVVTVGSYDLQFSSSTPWYESFRETFLELLPPSDHEFLSHCVGCIFVVSSSNTDPIGVFNSLSSQQQQQQTQFPNKLPRWFCPSVLKYNVLLHDVVEIEQSKGEAVYQSMKSTFGANMCHLLQINSRSVQSIETIKSDTNFPDPWSQFIPKPVENNHKSKSKYFIALEGADYEDHSFDDEAAFPNKLLEGTNGLDTSIIADSIETASEVTEGSQMSSSISSDNNIIDHPLAVSQEESSEEPSHVNSDPLSAEAASSAVTPNDVHYKMKSSLDVTKSGHGLCLTTSDHDRLRIFIHEFCVRALIPWAEKQMRILNEQYTQRKGIHRNLFKKWFGVNKPSSQVTANQNTSVVYTTDAPELQIRRLADLAFLFQMYDLAYQTYHTAKKDFNNDHAWIHLAGALEMASISIFMQGQQSQRQYPHHYMESAITTYLQTCRNPHYATRATIVSTEALKSQGSFPEASMQLIKMTSEDNDLRSALLLEQAAHCFIKMKTPMVRKYAFHMILSGHRFSKAGQRKHALRAYSQALQVYKGKNWTLAEDHINFTMGRQSFNLKQLENATATFKHLLTEGSNQVASQQGAFLREYLFVYRQLLTQDGSYTGTLPELPLPLIDCNETKVLLGNKPSPPQDGRIPASGVWFDYPENKTEKWEKLEESLIISANSGVIPSSYRPTCQLFTNRTDNKHNPVGHVGEQIIVELQVKNPLKVTLVLNDVTVLWSFLPSIAGVDKPQLITNEVATSVKNTLADEIIHTQLLEEVVLQGNDKIPIHLSLTPHQMGELHIVGIAYNLGTNSTKASNVDNKQTKQSFISTVNIRGKQRLDVQGPRLNTTKEEKVTKIYGPDRRLDFSIQQEMPLLQVHFCSFPRKLLCGEVHCASLLFLNIGSSPLHKLQVASSDPNFFTFGSQDDSPKFPNIYQTTENCDNKSSNKVVENLKIPRVVSIPVLNGMLQPKSSVTVPVWIRGNDIGGVHEIDFLFYYEPVQQFDKPRHRILRHTAVVNTLESLSVRAVAARGNSLKSAKSTEDSRSCIVSCELENLSQVKSQSAYVKEIQIQQISCASTNWTVHCIHEEDNQDVKMGCRETMQIDLKGNKLEAEASSVDGKSVMKFYSDVVYDDQRICSDKSPCSDFCIRSGGQKVITEPMKIQSSVQTTIENKVDNKDTSANLNCAIEIGLTLIILWKAYVFCDTGDNRVVEGQHHVKIDKIETVSTSYPFVLIQEEKPPVKFIRSVQPLSEKEPDLEVTSQLVDYSFCHKSSINHSFTKSRVCVVPVILLLQNCSNVSVYVLIDTSKSQDRLCSNSDVSGSSTPQSNSNIGNSSFTWASKSMIKLQLLPRDSRRVPLKACFSLSGVYNLNSLAVFVTYTEDSSEMILQKRQTASVIVISDAAS